MKVRKQYKQYIRHLRLFKSLSVSRQLLVMPFLWIVYGFTLFGYTLYTRGPPIGPDSAKYLFSGYLTTHGRITYKFIFSPKPPGNHLIATGLHLLFDGRFVTYAVSVGLMVVVISVTIWLIQWFVISYTGSLSAAFVAGIVPLTSELYGSAFLHGLLGKYITVMLFMAGLALISQHHRLWGVSVAGLAPVFWQFAIVFPLLVMAASLRDTENPEGFIGLTLLIWGAIAGIVMAPYFLAGAVKRLLVQSTLIPFVLDGSSSMPWYFFWSYISKWELALPVFAIACLGWIALAYEARARSDDLALAIVMGAVWFILGSILLGQLASLDILPLVPFVAIGTGIAVGFTPTTWSLDEIRTSFPNMSLQTAIIIIVFFWVLVSFQRWVLYPPYPMTFDDLGIRYLAGAVPEHCHAANNRIGQMFVEAVPWTPEVECASAHRILEWLGGY